MKKKNVRLTATVLCTLMTAVLIFNAVTSIKLEVEAANTFLGIQNLITEVAGSSKNYTVLEIVPDRSASEIGYLFDGYEPALSQWDAEEMRWKGWRELLADCADAEARKALINEMNTAIQKYYGSGFNSQGGFPVSSFVDGNFEYKESETYVEGYEYLEVDDGRKSGWFASKGTGAGQYQVAFSYGNYDPNAKKVYYIAAGENAITTDNMDDVAMSMPVYSKMNIGTDASTVYMYEGTWEEVSSKIEQVELESEIQVLTFEEQASVETEQPAEEEETPVETEQPVEEEQTPVETEQPAEAAQQPAEAVQQPAEAAQEPAEAAQEPVEAAQQPVEAAQQPAEAAQEPAEAAQQPVEAAQQPVEAAQEPAETEQVNDSQSQTTEEQMEAVVVMVENEPANEIQVLAEEGTELGYYLVQFEKYNMVEGEVPQEAVYTVYEKKEAAEGEYVFVESAEGGEEYEFSSTGVYIKPPFENDYWFHRQVLGMEESEYQDFPVEVITYTPDELAKALENDGHDGSFPKFDFLYINSGKNAGVAYTQGSTDTDGIDISSDVRTRLYAEVCERQLPCIVDGNILFTKKTNGTVAQNGSLKNTEIFKLSLALCQAKLLRVDEGAATDLDTLWKGLSEVAGSNTGHFTTDHVYCYTGDASFIQSDFASFTIYTDEEGNSVPAGFQKVLDEIDLENLTREAHNLGVAQEDKLPLMDRNISKAIVIRHIVNYQNSRNITPKSVLNVLEIQPAKTETDDKTLKAIPTLTLEKVQEWTDNAVTELNVTVMTTAEFIGKVETLNDKYDLIYIGADTSHMNTYTAKDLPGAKGSTVFNDTNMNGLIYYNIGDKRYSTMQLAGQLNSEYNEFRKSETSEAYLYYYVPVRYSGNDITEDKMNELFSYLDGSYPIVLADEFFESAATVYSDDNNERGDGGYSVDFEEGTYDKASMMAQGLRASDTNIIEVREGYKLIGYNTEDCSTTCGKKCKHTHSWEYTAGKHDLGANFAINSLKVVRDETTQSVRRIDANHIDNCSYMYKFTDTAINKYKNIYSYSEVSSDNQLFQYCLNRPKMQLELKTYGNQKSSQSTSGSGSQTNTAVGVNQDVYYIDPESGTYYLKYDFTIKNVGSASANTQYVCKIYIDVNADGRFSPDEVLDNLPITTKQGSGVQANQLYADREYTVKRAVPKGYKGVVPWKVEICQGNNPNIYCYASGYTKLRGQEKETIKVLQISRDQVLDPKSPWWGLEEEKFFSLAEEINGKKTQYEFSEPKEVTVNGDEEPSVHYTKSSAYSSEQDRLSADELNKKLYHTLVYGGTYDGVYYEGIKDDFDIDVDFYTMSKFVEEFNKFMLGKDENGDGMVDGINLDDYNMLILGFSDVFEDFPGKEDDPTTPLGAVASFIDSGRSVLMSHDNISFFNFRKNDVGVLDRSKGSSELSNLRTVLSVDPDELTGNKNITIEGKEFHSSYNLNQTLRKMVGMDRYGVQSVPEVKAGVVLEKGQEDFDKVISSGKQVAYEPKSGKTKTVPEAQGYTYTIINAKDKWDDEDIATPERIEQLKYFTKAETGLDYGWVNEYVNLDYGTVYYKDSTDYEEDEKYMYMDQGEIPPYYDASIDDLWVTQVNRGQVTDYPYKLADTFSVAETHGQYYQLDFTADDDGDGQNDLVVWFCLGARTDENGNFQETVYSASPNDVANNYFIYSKGNIVYTGMGHGGADSATRVEEAKLFINTIIAAYNAGIKPPTVTIMEDGSDDAYEKTVMYRYYDGEVKAADAGYEEINHTGALDLMADGDYENIYFTVEDTNFVKGDKKLAVNAYYTRYDGDSVINLPVKLENLDDNGKEARHMSLETEKIASVANTDFRARLTFKEGSFLNPSKDAANDATSGEADIVMKAGDKIVVHCETSMGDIYGQFSKGYQDLDYYVTADSNWEITLTDQMIADLQNTQSGYVNCIRFKKNGPKKGDSLRIDSVEYLVLQKNGTYVSKSLGYEISNESKNNEVLLEDADSNSKTLLVESVEGLYARYTFRENKLDLSVEKGKIITVTYKANVKDINVYLSYGDGTNRIAPLSSTTTSEEIKDASGNVSTEYTTTLVYEMTNSLVGVINGQDAYIQFSKENAKTGEKMNVLSITYGEPKAPLDSDKAAHPDGIAKQIEGKKVTRYKFDKVYNASNGAEVLPYELESGQRYYIKFPKSILADCDTGLQVYLEVHSIIKSKSGTEIGTEAGNETGTKTGIKTRYTSRTYDDLDIIKAYLFNLN